MTANLRLNTQTCGDVIEELKQDLLDYMSRVRGGYEERIRELEQENKELREENERMYEQISCD